MLQELTWVFSFCEQSMLSWSSRMASVSQTNLSRFCFLNWNLQPSYDDVSWEALPWVLWVNIMRQQGPVFIRDNTGWWYITIHHSNQNNIPSWTSREGQAKEGYCQNCAPHKWMNIFVISIYSAFTTPMDISSSMYTVMTITLLSHDEEN